MSVSLINGDSRTALASLPSGSVHCCVTSPPYFQLRDYEMGGQIGMESTPEEYVAQLVGVFRQVRRVLRDDGTLWVNIGDSYASAPGRLLRGGPPSASSTLEGSGHRGGGPKLAALRRVGRSGNKGSSASECATRPFAPGLKPKDMIGIPWMLAFALRADGWFLRQDIIWAKPNPMPESVTDRCTKAHEYLFLLSKSGRYHFDADAIAEPALKGAAGSTFTAGKTAGHQQGRAGEAVREEGERRNKRSVWAVATRPFRAAHFATFPPALIEPCILAGCPPGGMVLDPFMGAGTTGLAAARLGRTAIGVELNPAYVAMATARLRSRLVSVRGGADTHLTGLALFDAIGAA